MEINKNKINNYLQFNSLSIRNLEKQAGLTRDAIFNILHNRSKNPTIDTLVKIAKTINCTIEELINFDPIDLPKQQDNDVDTSVSYNSLLFANVVSFVDAKLDKDSITLQDFLRIISSIYRYSHQNNNKSLDSSFGDWIIAEYKTQNPK